MSIDPLHLTLFLLAAAALGGLLAFLVATRRTSSLETERTSLRGQLEESKQNRISLEREIQTLESRVGELRELHAEANARLESERDAAREKQTLLEQTELRLADTFKALSADALRSSSSQFLQLARESLHLQQNQANEELEKRRLSFEQLAKPIEENLHKVQTRIGEIEKSRGEAYAELKVQVAFMNESHLRLQRETSQLVKALRQPVGRGQWGELQLRKVVEMAGMQQHCDFVTQTTTHTDEGRRLRPDLIVNLPGGKTVVIDSKTPMDAYLEALDCEDEETRVAQLARHARQIRTHIEQLSSKRYAEQFASSPEFIVLFMPSESFFSAALQSQPELIERGVENGVILATPTTLIALLRAVAYGWRQEVLEQNAREIADLGRELHKRLVTMTSHFSKIGKALDQATKTYNSALGSFETRVLTTARRFEGLQASDAGQPLELLDPLECAARPPLAESSDERATKI